jgi:hypothetical protein
MNRLLLIGITMATGIGCLPGSAFAETSAPVQASAPPLAPALSDHPVTPAPAKPSPMQYLGAATQLLDAVSGKSLDGDGRKLLSQLRSDVTKLVKKYQSRTPAVPGAVDADAQDSNNAQGSRSWRVVFSDVERDFTAILGGGPLSVTSTTTVVTTTGLTASLAPTSPNQAVASSTQPARSSQIQRSTTLTPGGAIVTGAASSVAVPDIGVKHLNLATRSQLEQVRTRLELFYDAATNTTALFGNWRNHHDS